MDGAPVDRDLLHRMTEFMTFRGPDAQEIWTDGNVGFGHTMLRTTWEAETEKQPLTLDGKVWLTVDARIDGRSELIAELEAKLQRRVRKGGTGNGSGPDSVPNDAELILLAYEAWGEDCVQHLIGDFAFAIWDARERRLFCARDHLGVKPFYYAHVGNSLLFSNTIDCLRVHPQVSDELNDLAIADFLLFGVNYEMATTAFADIKRLPRAHCLKRSDRALDVSCYWTLPVNEPIRYNRESEYIDHFRELLRAAVGDRLRTNSVAVSLSGGLDSTTVAATAKQLLIAKQRPFDLRAFTIVYDHLLPDKERYYSGVAAEGLGIPIDYLSADSYRLFDRHAELRHPEPSDFPLPALLSDYLKRVANSSRVLLSGEGGDPLMLYTWRDLAKLAREFQWPSILKYVASHVFSYGRLPKLGYRSTVKYWMGKDFRWQYSLPTWLDRSLVERLNLTGRLEQINQPPSSVHPQRPDAYHNFMRGTWADLFERGDPGVTALPLEIRYPLFDLRLVNFFLRLPAIPWCVNKEMLRRSMKGILPEIIRRRPKTPLAGNQLAALLRESDLQSVNNGNGAGLDKYVNADALPGMSSDQDSDSQELNLRAICLNYWLQDTLSPTVRVPMEECDGIGRQNFGTTTTAQQRGEKRI